MGVICVRLISLYVCHCYRVYAHCVYAGFPSHTEYFCDVVTAFGVDDWVPEWAGAAWLDARLHASPLLQVEKWFDLCAWANNVIFVYQKCDMTSVAVTCFGVVFYEGLLIISISVSFWAHNRSTPPNPLAGIASYEWLNQSAWVRTIGSSQGEFWVGNDGWPMRARARNRQREVLWGPLVPHVWWLTTLNGQVTWARNKPCGFGDCSLSKTYPDCTVFFVLRGDSDMCHVLWHSIVFRRAFKSPTQNHSAWLWFLAPPLTNCVNLGEVWTAVRLSFLICKIGNLIIVLILWNGYENLMC